MTAPDDCDPCDDLQNALIDIQGVADVLHAVGFHDAGAAYLANRLHEHSKKAHDAFCRIYKLDQYAEPPVPA